MLLRAEGILLLTASALAQAPVAKPANDLNDLPLIEVAAQRPTQGRFAVLLTGDGGWAPVDRRIAADLTKRGIPVVGFNSAAYLRHAKTPEQTARDISRVLRTYESAWNEKRVVLIGYSRGADMLPFVVNRLDTDLKKDVDLVAMLGIGLQAGFEFHLIDLVRDIKRPSDLPTMPELLRLKGMRMLCVYGEEEKESACRDAPAGLVTAVSRKGGHHFEGDYEALGDLITSALPALK